jgi:hypothetical protein
MSVVLATSESQLSCNRDLVIVVWKRRPQIHKSDLPTKHQLSAWSFGVSGNERSCSLEPGSV